MDNKKILIGLGAIALIGGVFYFYNKSKNSKTDVVSEESTESSVDKSVETNTTTPTAPTTPNTPVKILTPQELESKLASCGKKPKRKKWKVEYNKCRTNLTNKLKAEGLVAFDGSYVIDENVVGEGFFSNFDNGLDLDL